MTDAQKGTDQRTGGLRGFLTMRVLTGIAVAIVVVWGVWFVSGWFGGDETSRVSEDTSHGPSAQVEDRGGMHTPSPTGEGEAQDDGFPLDRDAFPLQETAREPEGGGQDSGMAGHGISGERGQTPEHGRGIAPSLPGERHSAGAPMPLPGKGDLHGPATTGEPKAVGVAFMEATISVLDYELNDRFWGWRPNDLIRFTDNVENMQLGVLEVVRRTSVVLMERLSRHGVAGSIDKNLENAMNWLMINSDRYWLPSAEQKYNDSLQEFRSYAEKLERGEARFYVRTDTLIPLLGSLADLAGSSDENLVKSYEEGGSPVSWFMTDDYFYYAKGVARAMVRILEAVGEDFSDVLEARHGTDLLNRAVHACHVASELEPWVVTNAPLDGILANHRANMAAEISHVRYFLSVLATSLAT